MLFIAYQIGLSESEFWGSTYRNFTIRLEAYRANKEAEQQAEWERLRWLSSVLLAPHSKRKLRPRDITIFPWEMPDKVPNSIPKDLLKLAEAMDAQAKKQGLVQDV